MIKRIFDLISSSIVLVLLTPLLFLISLLIILDSKGGPFYIQVRIGQNGIPFGLYKFRSMRIDTEGLKITVGKDPRITKIGSIIRKYKLDELPQLINIIKGEMSVVGPRPETPNYVELYSEEQKKVLKVKPGLTDYASLYYIDESRILSERDNPEKAYIEEVMPAKLMLNQKYIQDASFWIDMKIIFITLFKILR
tara:strand:- start:1107 stop:1691 length:585 start_codon:yes stop_codon:yes gene_type:complete